MKLIPLNLSKAVEFNAFEAMKEGVPLATLQRQAHEKGMVVNLAVFACDAYAAGWDEFKVRTTLQEACRANAIHFDWVEFDRRMAETYKLACTDVVTGKDLLQKGALESDAYRAMKKWLVNHWTLRFRAKQINDLAPSRINN